MGVVLVWMHGGLSEPAGDDPGTFRPEGTSRRALAELESSFAELGIDCREVGFYLQPAFRAAELAQPALFHRYAQFVEARHYDDAYLARARRLIPRIAAWLRDELAKGGQQGACLDCSLALSRVLEKLGLWNYVTAGSVTVEFDPQTGVKKHHWPHLLGDPHAVGHAWVTAPPFRVIDLTIAQQRSSERIRPHLPAMIVSEQSEAVGEVSLDDLLHPDLQLRILSRYGTLPTIRQILDNKPEMADLMRTFPPFAVGVQSIRAKYFPCCTTALEEPFENVQSTCFSGRSLPVLLDDLLRETGLDYVQA